MKWTKAGHEFDGFWDEISDIEAVWIFGAGLSGKSVYKLYSDRITILGFMDNDPAKQGTRLHGLEVRPPDEVELGAHQAVVVAMAPEILGEVLDQLRGSGRRAYDMHVFFPVYSMYRWGELVITSLSFLPTTRCNLNCRDCLNFTPYLRGGEFRPLQSLKADLDLLFGKLDGVVLLHVSGGEPFLYPDLAALLEYTARHYGHKLGRLETVTNGTVVPSDALCETLAEYGVSVVLDDYREAVPRFAGVFPQVEEKFRRFGVLYRVQHVDAWVDLRPGEPSAEASEEAQRKHFEECRVPWQEYRGGRLYLCNYAAYAAVAGLCRMEKNEMLDLRTDPDKRTVMEFRLGYSQKGYTGFCRHCAGYMNNPYSVEPAVQVQGGRISN